MKPNKQDLVLTTEQVCAIYRYKLILVTKEQSLTEMLPLWVACKCSTDQLKQLGM